MSSRAEHHADSSESRVRDAKAQLAAILKVRDCREWAISSKGLADAVGLKATTVRDCIPEIRREYNLPVVACSRGYYVITDPRQLEHELDRIQSEIQTRRDRKQELTAAFNRRRADRE